MRCNICIVIFVIVAVMTAGVYYLGSDKNTIEDSGAESMGALSENSYSDISASDAKVLIDSNPDLIVIDVSPYYEMGHLPGAVSYYPLTLLEEAIPDLDSSASYLVYCHADTPSRAGAQMLADEGFANVYRLEGNYIAWFDAGYEVEV